MASPLVVTVPGRPVSLNAERNRHWSARASHVRAIRESAFYEAKMMMPRVRGVLFERVTIEVQPYVKDRRYRTDVGNIYPTFKAALDGLVDARVIEDDSDEFVRAITFLPCLFGSDQLVLTVTDAT